MIDKAESADFLSRGLHEERFPCRTRRRRPGYIRGNRFQATKDLSGIVPCITLIPGRVLTLNPECRMPAASPLLHSSVDQGVLILTVTQPRIQGEETAQQLREEMQLALEKAGVNRVVVDLQHVRYLSSVAFWPLLSLRRHLLDTGGRLMICGLSGDIEVLFLTTKMISSGGAVDAPFEVASDVAAAVARLLA